MQIAEVIQLLEKETPLYLQEKYDNAGLIIGNKNTPCTGILCTLDATEEVIAEAIEMGCNLIVAHHPILFNALKKITGNDYVERAIILAIKNDISLYAIHTNLDHKLDGVNAKIAEKLELKDLRVLTPKSGLLQKLYTYVPLSHKEKILEALFAAGGGLISDYSECSFSAEGKGTFKAGENSKPFLGEIGKRAEVDEAKVEIIFPSWLQQTMIDTLKKSHPYEEVAYEVIRLENTSNQWGAGILGLLPEPMDEQHLLQKIKDLLGLRMIKHTKFLQKSIHKVALCGGAGSFLIKDAIAAGADFFLTSDIKYHEFFDADGKIVVADAGHWETEQFTIDLLFEFLQKKFPNFAVLKTKVRTNPVFYDI
ncbi:MAG: Nif3-like dinuclear metal center hexameric protein [Bacteroidetes bacterium]|nr:Nif3-like dinuclear metal center hexameric protein [Bacteroidota bacterium]